MLFLATPHRGTNLAQTLNNILRVSASLSPRAYISNLAHQNELLSLLNDTFRHYASDVSLYSFCESRATELYIHSELIVPKESAILGYQNERHAMLDADHRSICKFEKPTDSNYVAVRDALANMAGVILKRGRFLLNCQELLHRIEQTFVVSSTNYPETRKELQQIHSYLAMPETPEDDFKDLEESRIDGSCEWFADRETFQKWIDPDSGGQSMIYWLSANPATGKSVLSGYVISALANLSLDCSYHFFRHGNKDQSTVGGFLRSLLYQMAIRSVVARQQLLSLIEKAVTFNKDDAKAIWRKIVWPIVSSLDMTGVYYWVLDALDECSDFEVLFPMIASLDRSCHIRILVTSRKLPEITQQFVDLRRRESPIYIFMEEILVEDTKVDIRLYLDGNRAKFHVGNDQQKDRFIAQIIDKSEGCFLWVRLVLDELAQTWSVGEVQRILDEVPQKMDQLYSRALTIMSSRSKPNRDLARAILTWIICSVRPLSVDELKESLMLDMGAEVSELESAIASLCAQLVHVDKMGRVMIVHLTAKTFLVDERLDSEFHVNTKSGHLRLAHVCLSFLCSDKMKLPQGRRLRKSSRPQVRSPFTTYACFEFADHLRQTTSLSPIISSKLYEFLDSNVFSWIEFVAMKGNMMVLTRAANSIKAYLQRHIRSSSPLGEFVHLTQNWVVDLHHIATGFGANLLTYPGAIYWLIPPFCPRSSAIAQTAASRFKGITVRGLKDKGWDDRLSCIDVHDRPGSSVACADAIFAVGYHHGFITLHRNSTCLLWKTLDHRSPVQHLVFNGSNTHLLSAGRRDIKAWEVETGSIVWADEISHDVMHLAITENGETVIAADRGSTLTFWNMQSGRVERTFNWTHRTPFHEEGKFRRPPLTAALSPDAYFLAVVYRGRPICVFDLEEDAFHGVVSREKDPAIQRLGTNTSPTSLVFNASKDSSKFAAAYEDGDLCLFDYEELRLLKTTQANAQLVTCSPDGLTLATGNSAGMVQLLEFDTLQLLYQVNAAGYGIRGLSFSADNLRFLDVRETQCNIWEPAVLSGLAKQDDSSTEPAKWEPIIKGMDDEEVEITSIQLQSASHFFIGRSDGSVSVHDTISGELEKVLYRHKYQISVTSTVWGSQRNILATSDTSCRFIVCALVPDREVAWAVDTKLLDERADSTVLQLLLDPSNELLLVSTERSNSVWNLKNRKLLSIQTWQPAPSFCWMNQPERPGYRTLVTTAAATIVDWESATNVGTSHLLQMSNDVPGEVQGIKNAFTFSQGRLLVVEISELYKEKFTTETLMFRMNVVSSEGLSLDPITTFSGISKKIRHLIGAYNSRLLFVDMGSWVCSINTDQGDWDCYSRHFPIPSDWRGQQRQFQMAITEKGEILFVRRNEIAIISNGLSFEERLRD